MLKSLPKIIIVFSMLVMPMLLGASYANAASYTCKGASGACYGTYSTAACGTGCVTGNQYNQTCVEFNNATGCTNLDTTAAAPAETTTGESVPFVPEVSIGKDFAAGTSYTPDGSTSMIGKYIRAIYKYAIGIVGILAAVVLMVGGVMWIVAGGNATAIGEAKSWIGASLTGLVLALSSYLILATINPALVDLKTTTIKPVEKSTTESGTGKGCCLGGDSPTPYFFECQDNIASASCVIGLFPAAKGITRVAFGEDKKCKSGTGLTQLARTCE